MILIGVLAVIFVAFLVVVNLLDNKSLNGIKAKKVGNGQHGTARWATKAEVNRTFISLPFEPDKWRKGENRQNLQRCYSGYGVGRQRFTRKKLWLLWILR